MKSNQFIKIEAEKTKPWTHNITETFNNHMSESR